MLRISWSANKSKETVWGEADTRSDEERETRISCNNCNDQREMQQWKTTRKDVRWTNKGNVGE